MSKQGNPWAAVTLEDLDGSVEVLFFGETYLAYSTVLAEDAVVVVRGRVRRRDETMQLQAMEVSLPDVSHGGGRAGRRLAAGGPVHAAGGRAAARGPRRRTPA